MASTVLHSHRMQRRKMITRLLTDPRFELAHNRSQVWAGSWQIPGVSWLMTSQVWTGSWQIPGVNWLMAYPRCEHIPGVTSLVTDPRCDLAHDRSQVWSGSWQIPGVSWLMTDPRQLEMEEPSKCFFSAWGKMRGIFFPTCPYEWARNITLLGMGMTLLWS